MVAAEVYTASYSNLLYTYTRIESFDKINVSNLLRHHLKQT